MARLNYSGIAITGGTGRLNSALGGTVLLKNGVARSYSTPSNPQTSSQLAQRALLAAAVSSWSNTLTEEQRAAYNQAAASGEWSRSDTFTGTSVFPSGQSLYIQLYLNVASAGGAVSVISNPPTKADMGNYILTGLATAVEAGSVTYAYTGDVGTDGVAIVYATPPISAGKTVAPGGSYRKIAEISLFTTSPQNIGTEYAARFGALTGQAGKKIFLKVEVVNSTTGQRVDAGAAHCIVTS